MKASKRRSLGRRWFRFVLAGALIVGSHLLHVGSAEAASTHLRPLGTATVATATGATGGTVLGGFTSQSYPSFVKISANGRMLEVGAIALNMTCTSGAQFVLSDGFVRIPIGPKGHLHRTRSEPPTSGPDGDTYSVTDSLHASLNRTRTELSGVWDLRVQYSFTNGMSDLCDSGPVRFIDVS